MNTGKRNSDNEAADWDHQPGRVKLANDVARAISGAVKPNRQMEVLDFGCGTGLLTVALQPLGGGERVFTVFLMTGRKCLHATLGVRAK